MAKGKKKKPGASQIASNKKAFHNYHIVERYTAGIVLTGSEIKAIRHQGVSLAQSFARIDKGEMWLFAMHIPPYDKGGYINHDPTRVRKLLLKKKEISKLVGTMQQKGLTLVPLKLFFSRCWVKVELGLCKGKELHDKRHDLAKKDQQRQMDRAKKLQG